MGKADFQCREGCAACCIAPSINTPFFGMPRGKKAGERCVWLDDRDRCKIHDSEMMPKFCARLKPSLEMCGLSATEAFNYLRDLENATKI